MTRHPSAKNETGNTPGASSPTTGANPVSGTTDLATLLEAAFGKIAPEPSAPTDQVVALDAMRPQSKSPTRDTGSKPTWALDVLSDLQNLAAHNKYAQLETDLQVCISFLSSRMDSYEPSRKDNAASTPTANADCVEPLSKIVSFTRPHCPLQV
jgi:hypothetical protein